MLSTMSATMSSGAVISKTNARDPYAFINSNNKNNNHNMTATTSLSSSSLSSSASSSQHHHHNHRTTSSQQLPPPPPPHHHHHPELEQLAATMPPATIDSAIRSQSRMSISYAKGLLNMPGQNNCFLNSAVQVLWHLDVFRRNFREVHGHACMGESCIFCALKELFNQFQSSKESALPPDMLRFALAEAFSDQRRFQLGYMDDAAECFENILLRIHYHLTNQEVNDSSPSQCAPHCIPHQKFAMNLFEQISCHACGATSEPFVFSQMVQYASTTALCSQEKLFKGDGLSFGGLLKLATSIGDIRNCPEMCGTQINIKKVLVNRPDVISIGLVWDSEQPTISFIRNIFQLIGTSIRLNEVFDQNENAAHLDAQLNLVGLVTYYGKHYSTYLYNTKLSEWIYFDDATVRVIGPSWQQVMDKCVKGHFQPLLLLYANPDGTVVDTRFALPKVVPMTAIKKTSVIPSPLPPPPQTLKNNPSKKEIKTIPPYRTKETNYLDMPDSPSATSTTSYFSDFGDSTDGYISRKTVEKIFKIQQNKKKEAADKLTSLSGKSNRNSSSSLESFGSAIRINTLATSQQRPSAESGLTCSLQRRDSGNSSGDRSSSVSSVETPYYNYRRYLKSVCTKSSKHSDAGYDSFSVSSSDSYPSTTNAVSPSKLPTHKLKQIPEDVQLLEVIGNAPSPIKRAIDMNECDRLCSEVDILLLKSHEKEQEGDLRAAAALSDSAAAKARNAMDAPYSNYQTLVSAKMKHSMCVMRSTSLHKRVQELEVEERRLLKAAVQEYHHSRQSSRDSTHNGRHSRQGSKDGKDTKSLTKDITPPSKSTAILKPTSPSVEIYATLPKRTKKKSSLKNSNGNLTTDETVVGSNSTLKCEKSAMQAARSSLLAQLQTESRVTRPASSDRFLQQVRESEHSDYYSEWEGLKKKKSIIPSNSSKFVSNSIGNGKNGNNHLTVSHSGWQSCRENDSECYGEIGGSTTATLNLTAQRKQCKVKRKLLLGGLLKSKNRSMPDLREDGSVREKSSSEFAIAAALPPIGSSTSDEASIIRSSVANVSAKGFHQSHRSFVTEQGLSSKPSLLKVKPPLISEIATSVCKPTAHNDCIYANVDFATMSFRADPTDLPITMAITTMEPSISPPLPPPPTPPPPSPPPPPPPPRSSNPFLAELTKKRREILKRNESYDNISVCSSYSSSSATSMLIGGKIGNKPKPREIATIISKMQQNMHIPTEVEHCQRMEQMTISRRSSQSSLLQPQQQHQNQQQQQQYLQHQNQYQLQQQQQQQSSPFHHSTLPVQMPIPINLASMPSRPMRPPDYETALRRIEQRSNLDARIPVQFPIPPAASQNMFAQALRHHTASDQPNSMTALTQSPTSSSSTSTPSVTSIAGSSPFNMSHSSNSNHAHVAKSFSAETNNNNNNNTSSHHNNLATTMTTNASSGNQSINAKRLPPPDNGKPGDRIKSNLPASVDRNSKLRQSLPKKSVKFSDNIEWVACADDYDDEEHLPNPLLEKVLANKNVVYTLQQ